MSIAAVNDYITRMQAATAKAGKVETWPASSSTASVINSYVTNLIDPKADVLLWASNSRSPMDDMLAAWLFLGLITRRQAEATTEAKDAQDREFLAEYRANQPAQPSAEERAEARAAHGPGVVLVDAFTGRKFTT